MGRPGPDPRPRAALRGRGAEPTCCRSRRASTRPTSPTSRRPSPTRRRSMTRRADRPARSSTTRAAPARCWPSTTTSAELVKTLQQDRPAQEHADRLRLRQRLAPGRAPDHRRQVPALRGVAAGAADPARPRRARRARRSTARSRTSTSRRRWSTSANAKAGRTMDGVSLLPTIRDPKQRPNRALEIEALAPLFAGNDPGQRLGPALHRACAPTATRTSSGPRPARRSSTTARPTRTSSTTSPPIPPTRRSRPTWRASWPSSSTASGAACNVSALRHASLAGDRGR